MSIIIVDIGGLGLVTEEMLIGLGYTHVVLTSRSGKVKSYERQDLQKRLNRLLKLRDGIIVSIECCDMRNEDTVCSFTQDIQ